MKSFSGGLILEVSVDINVILISDSDYFFSNNKKWFNYICGSGYV